MRLCAWLVAAVLAGQLPPAPSTPIQSAGTRNAIAGRVTAPDGRPVLAPS